MRSTTTALAQLYTIAMPIMAFFELSLFGQVVIVADLVFVALALSLVVEIATTRENASRLTRAFLVGCAVYVLSFAVAAWASSDPTRAFKKGTSALYVAAIGVVFAIVCADDARRRAVLRAWRLGAALVVGYAVVSLVAVSIGGASFAENDPLVRGWSAYLGSLPIDGYRRPTATFLNFNMLSTYLGATACVHLALDDEARSRGSTLLFVGVLALAVATLSPTLSGTVIALAWLMTRDRPTGVVRAVRALAVVVGVAIFASTFFSPRTIADGGGLAIGPRPLCWLAAFGAWTTSLRTVIVGNGPGITVFEVHALAGQGFTARLTDAHHVLLSILVQAGLFGAAGFASVVAPLVRAARRATLTRESTALVVGAFTLWGIDGLTGSFEDTRHFWVILGLTSGALSRQVTARVAPSSE